MTKPVDFFRQTLAAMPDFFYSQEFYSALRKTPCPEKALKNGGATDFLKRNAFQQGFNSRSWVKKASSKTAIKSVELPEMPTPLTPLGEMIAADSEPKQLTESEAIEFLKARGYKIYKFQEI